MIRETIRSALCTIAAALCMIGGAVMTARPVHGLIVVGIGISFAVIALFFVKE